MIDDPSSPSTGPGSSPTQAALRLGYDLAASARNDMIGSALDDERQAEHPASVASSSLAAARASSSSERPHANQGGAHAGGRPPQSGLDLATPYARDDQLERIEVRHVA